MTWRGPHTANRTTTARGYGAAHQAERRRRLPNYTPASPCGYCGQPLGPDRKQWHLPHNAQRTGYLPGFWCADCNRKDGARRGQQRQRAKQMAMVSRVSTSRRW